MAKDWITLPRIVDLPANTVGLAIAQCYEALRFVGNYFVPADLLQQYNDCAILRIAQILIPHRIRRLPYPISRACVMKGLCGKVWFPVSGRAFGGVGAVSGGVGRRAGWSLRLRVRFDLVVTPTGKIFFQWKTSI
ncbi:MAG: hypothetical protein ABR971_07330 [Acidobacteriaceae bacterium]